MHTIFNIIRKTNINLTIFIHRILNGQFSSTNSSCPCRSLVQWTSLCSQKMVQLCRIDLHRRSFSSNLHLHKPHNYRGPSRIPYANRRWRNCYPTHLDPNRFYPSSSWWLGLQLRTSNFLKNVKSLSSSLLNHSLKITSVNSIEITICVQLGQKQCPVRILVHGFTDLQCLFVGVGGRCYCHCRSM